jgi:hypothetical protein
MNLFSVEGHNLFIEKTGEADISAIRPSIFTKAFADHITIIEKDLMVVILGLTTGLVMIGIKKIVDMKMNHILPDPRFQVIGIQKTSDYKWK